VARADAAPDVTIATSGHDVADARLHRLAVAFGRAGLTVEVLGLGDAADGPDGAAVRTRARGTLLGRARTALEYARGARGRVLIAVDPDVLVAARAIAHRRAAVVADVHEDYAALLRDRDWATGPAGAAGRLVAALATRAARGSDLVLVADEHVPPRDAPHRLVVRNLPDLGMLPSPRDAGPVPRAVYVGDVRPSRGLWTMLDAIADAPGWELDIVGPTPGSARADLDRRLGGRALAGRVRVHGRQPPVRAWQLARGAWCGLALLDDTPAFHDALPSKLYEYLGCGLPVVVTDLPRQAGVVTGAGVGAVVPTGPGAAAATARVLRAWSAAPAALGDLHAAAVAWRDENLPADPYREAAEAVAALVRRTERSSPRTR
jgi:glycosyltransferase involved in cell wall biosynthesis